MKSNINTIRFKRAFGTLLREIQTYLDIEYFDITIYGLDRKSMKENENLPLLVEVAKGIIEDIRSRYTPTWNLNYTYVYWEHAEIMENQLKILEPIANSMFNDDKMDISEIIAQVIPPKVLPDGINYSKYNDIFEELKLPRIMFEYIFVCENILRKFIIKVLNDNGYSSIRSLGHSRLSSWITDRENDEARQKYLPVRGGHDIYYLDLKQLSKVMHHVWTSCFIDKFDDYDWINSRIKSLYNIRNRVAHNSGFLTNEELDSIETYTREIIKQIDPFIP